MPPNHHAPFPGYHEESVNLALLQSESQDYSNQFDSLPTSNAPRLPMVRLQEKGDVEDAIIKVRTCSIA
jgi:hypothetical protein